MKIIITCGPSYEPIDGARRMTNMSKGFALCHADGCVQTCSDAPALCESILEWLLRPLPSPVDAGAAQPA